MSAPAGLVARLDELADHGEKLRLLGKWLSIGGFGVLMAAMLFFAPDPGANNAFDLYLAVPPDLVDALHGDGAAITTVPPFLIGHGGGIPWFVAFCVPILLVLRRAFRTLVPNRLARFLIIWLSPFWVALLFSGHGNRSSSYVDAARIGVIVDRPGMPAAAADGTGKRIVEPYVLHPDRFAGAQADEARYILAQQAYLAGDPAAVGRHLRAMTGSWRPADDNSRMRMAILDDYAEASGHKTGGAAAKTGAFGRHVTLSRTIAAALLLAGGGTVLFALLVDITGRQRITRSGRLKGRIEGMPAMAFAAPAPEPAVRRASFGRRG